VTKTDLAKYINAWNRQPDIVSRGSQKNFIHFMASIATEGAESPLPTPLDYKVMIAKAKLFREVQKLVRPMFQAFQANVAAYVVSVLVDKLGDRIDLERIWTRQGVSTELMSQVGTWAKEVNDVLHRTSGGRMISEWAKRPECREAVLGANYSASAKEIPELR
jgi:GNAT superfamily N-acetyltransferase